MLWYEYRKSHCGDKRILRPSYFYNRISYTVKMTLLYRIRAWEGLSSYMIIRMVCYYYRKFDLSSRETKGTQQPMYISVKNINFQEPFLIIFVFNAGWWLNKITAKQMSHLVHFSYVYLSMQAGPHLNIKTVFSGIEISIVETKWSHNHLLSLWWESHTETAMSFWLNFHHWLH